jgi:hypothetical protein
MHGMRPIFRKCYSSPSFDTDKSSNKFINLDSLLLGRRKAPRRARQVLVPAGALSALWPFLGEIGTCNTTGWPRVARRREAGFADSLFSDRFDRKDSIVCAAIVPRPRRLKQLARAALRRDSPSYPSLRAQRLRFDFASIRRSNFPSNAFRARPTRLFSAKYFLLLCKLCAMLLKIFFVPSRKILRTAQDSRRKER